MGRDAAAGPLSPRDQALDDRARLRGVARGACGRRSGGARTIGRAGEARGVHARRPVPARRLQGNAAQLPLLGRPDAPGDPARRYARAGLRVTAAGPLPAPILGIGYGRHRSSGEQMPFAMMRARHRRMRRHRARVLPVLALALWLAPLSATRAETVLVSNEKGHSIT